MLTIERHCLAGGRWDDSLVGALAEHGFANVSLDDPERVNTINVEHWRLQDTLEAAVDRPVPADLRIRVWHAEVDPQTRSCAVCGKQVGTGG